MGGTHEPLQLVTHTISRGPIINQGVWKMKQLLVKRAVFALVMIAAIAAVAGYMGPAYGQATHEAAAVFLKEIPPGYRDWKVISVAHEEGNLNSLGAILGN